MTIRINVTGNAGAGQTTLALALGEAHGSEPEPQWVRRVAQDRCDLE